MPCVRRPRKHPPGIIREESHATVRAGHPYFISFFLECQVNCLVTVGKQAADEELSLGSTVNDMQTTMEDSIECWGKSGNSLQAVSVSCP